MQQPDRTDWQAEDVQGMDRITDIGQDDVAQAIGTQILAAIGLEQHG